LRRGSWLKGSQEGDEVLLFFLGKLRLQHQVEEFDGVLQGAPVFRLIELLLRKWRYQQTQSLELLGIEQINPMTQIRPKIGD